MKRAAVIVVVMAMALLGCGSDDDTDNEAPAKCEVFKASFCGRTADCSVAADPRKQRQTEIDECASTAARLFNCSAAVAVAPSYSQCLTDISAATCSSLAMDVPASCKMVILLP